ncbi:hypothetical protein TNCV_102921 [Trichonephila clavipes]|nr:hypothetical protein TNCV_102921 [Trichonephila clavipes]
MRSIPQPAPVSPNYHTTLRVGSSPVTTENPPCRGCRYRLNLSRHIALPLAGCSSSERGCQLHALLVNRSRFKIPRSVANSLRVALEGDDNTHCPTQC